MELAVAAAMVPVIAILCYFLGRMDSGIGYYKNMCEWWKRQAALNREEADFYKDLSEKLAIQGDEWKYGIRED